MISSTLRGNEQVKEKISYGNQKPYNQLKIVNCLNKL